MKKKDAKNLLFALSCSLLFAGLIVDALSYDYSASTKCEANPQRPQYGGGVLINPEMNEGLLGWTNYGAATKIEHRVSKNGNKFIVAYDRTQPHHSVSQKVYLEKDKLYSLSAWVQVDKENALVTATVKTPKGFKHVAGSVFAKSGCWSMIKGGFTADSSSGSELFFESNNTSVEIWIDSVSLQPFTKEEWNTHRDHSLQKIRKSKLRIQVVDAHGNPLSTNISITQNRLNFPFGVAINQNILNNPSYQSWFSSRPFTVTTFENEMKWASTERVQGQKDYSVPDAMLKYAQSLGIQVRGHNVLWEDPKYQPQWVYSLSPDDLRSAAMKRIKSIISKYKGQVIAWDVVNENLHDHFFEDKLGGDASALFYHEAHNVDGQTLMFMNEYNTIEEPGDGTASPASYINKINQIRSYGPTAIGLESHFSRAPDMAYVRSALDTLAATGFPIWITELDVASIPNQEGYLDQVLREVHAHPAVKGIVVWGPWNPQGCYRMCLTDNNFNNLPTGNVIDKFVADMGGKPLFGTTDANGLFQAEVFHGNYQLKVVNPNASATNLDSQSIEVTVGPHGDYTTNTNQGVVTVQVSA